MARDRTQPVTRAREGCISWCTPSRFAFDDAPRREHCRLPWRMTAPRRQAMPWR